MNSRLLCGSVLLASAFLLCLPYASALERSLAQEVPPGQPVEVIFTGNHSVGERIVLSELLPQGATLRSYQFGGVREVTPPQHDGHSITWEVEVTAPQQSLIYAVELANGSQATFDAVYATSTESFGNLKSTVRVVPAPQPPAPDPSPEQSTPLAVPRQHGTTLEWMLLLSAILFAVAGFVFVLETSARHRAKTPFGHHTAHLARHTAGHVHASVVGLRAALQREASRPPIGQ